MSECYVILRLQAILSQFLRAMDESHLPYVSTQWSLGRKHIFFRYSIFSLVYTLSLSLSFSLSVSLSFLLLYTLPLLLYLSLSLFRYIIFFIIYHTFLLMD